MHELLFGQQQPASKQTSLVPCWVLIFEQIFSLMNQDLGLSLIGFLCFVFQVVIGASQLGRFGDFCFHDPVTLPCPFLQLNSSQLLEPKQQVATIYWGLLLGYRQTSYFCILNLFMNTKVACLSKSTMCCSGQCQFGQGVIASHGCFVIIGN